ncbi:histidine kinase dimerization/phosphoacceptor domain -containing protein [Marispirochaeta aestuarii]|uniref:histidine kinase dimerization/phosphoacceptor domain -containing protein n=1 Tax=Marispirochaeta aestuarii TaxID=1963862 RepID=UPI0029C87761|nr:histidine kinase dimerization/phosphoacceptor domain -containing protein [Marispirochaeta aestuarii]
MKKVNEEIKRQILGLLAVVLFVGTIWGIVNSWYFALAREYTRNHFVELALPYRESFIGAIKERFALVEGLASFASAVPEETVSTAFNDFAAGIFDEKKGIRNISIAPGGIQKYVYPLRTNEIVSGHNLLKDPRPEVQKDIKLAMETGELIISGPYELRQGGQGLIARKALFRDDSFQGLVTIVLDMPPIYRESGIQDARKISITLLDAQQRLFFGPEPGENPINLKMQITDEVWQMLVMPKNSWQIEYFRVMQPFFFMTIIIALFSGGGLFLLARKMFSLSRKARLEQLRYKNLFNSISDAIFVTDEQRRIIDANQPALQSMFGYDLDEIAGKDTSLIYASRSDFDKIGNLLSEKSTDRTGTLLEVALKRKDGSVFPAEISIPRYLDNRGKTIGKIGIIRDITDRKLAREALHREIEEKKTLLREIHHRVKNNLNIVASLLNLQKNEFQTEVSARQSFDDMAKRIHSMAMIHDSLYNSGSLSSVTMSTYIRKLISELNASLGRPPLIRIDADLEDIQLNITSAVPCGILINELITNAIKHAFRDRSEGRIHVSLEKKTGTHTIVLTVKDNGSGLNPDFSLESSASLGMRLIQLLTSQLDGTLSYSSNQGATFSVEFEE